MLGEVVGRFGLERSLDDYRIWQAWDEVVGPAIARNAQPQKLSANRLVIAVRNAGWMQELTMLRRDLCDRLNAWMGREVIKEIFLVVGKVDNDEPRNGQRRARPTGTKLAEQRRQRVTPEELDAAIAKLWKIAESRSQESDDSDDSDN